jgi:gluconolactonase
MVRRKWGRALMVGAVTGLIAAATAPGAAAAPDCPDRTPARVRTLLSGQGTLESVAVDRRGHLFFTNDNSLLRLDRPNGQPRVMTLIDSPGGLAFDEAGNVIVGYGNSPENGTVGDQTGPSGLLKVDPITGASEVFATGLSMANGVARAPDGSYYASNDFGSNIDRIQNGVTERGWSHVDSGNGLAIDREGRYLYVAQTFRPAAIQRIDLSDPTNVTPYVTAGPEDISAGLDGMTRDARNTLFVAANGAGQIWRIDPDPAEICVLLRGLPGFPDGPSAVATGSPHGHFPPENLYVVTFDGNLIELTRVASRFP